MKQVTIVLTIRKTLFVEVLFVLPAVKLDCSENGHKSTYKKTIAWTKLAQNQQIKGDKTSKKFQISTNSGKIA